MISAISTAKPQPEDILATNHLSKALEPFQVMESEAEKDHRIAVLAKLDALVEQWIKAQSIAINMLPQLATASPQRDILADTCLKVCFRKTRTGMPHNKPATHKTKNLNDDCLSRLFEFFELHRLHVAEYAGMQNILL